MMRGRDFRFNRLAENLLEKLDRLLVKVNRGEDPSPECPICKLAGGSGKMVRHTWRGAICDDCGTRVW